MTAIAIGLASPARAQCTPDPTGANGTTTCTGSDADGLQVTTPQTRVIVATSATVSAGNGAAALVSASTSSTLTINGQVSGGSKPGLLVTNGAAYYGVCDPYAGAAVPGSFTCTPGTSVLIYPGGSSTITIAQNASVTGSQALLLQRASGNTTGTVAAYVTNSGTLSASSGPAVIADAGGILQFTNLSPGVAGGVSGALQSVSNGGLINGGTGAAVAGSAGASFFVSNSGRLISNSTAATVSGGGFNVTNSANGVIRNDGAGNAIESTGALGISNGGGTIVGGIVAGGPLTLSNTGTITGAVQITSTLASSIDTSQGTINGNVTFGGGDDVLRARFDPVTGTISSITGTVDGGGGTDTVVLAVTADTTLAAAVLPTNFERLGLDLANVTATLAPSFTTPGGLQLSGVGTLVNNAALTTSGPAIIATSSGGTLKVDNRGTITATLSNAGQAAIALPSTVLNSGTITATGGDGVRASSSIANTNRITASGTAAALSFGTLTNSATGTIQSTGGIGAAITGQGSYSASTNAGTISGATVGVALASARLTNSGTITGGTAGVSFGYGGTLANAGGTISGGIINTSTSATVLNAGTINGNVNLASSTTFDSSNDVFVDNGGTVNGAIGLGGGDDLLVVDLASPAGRPLAGATSGVDAGAGYDTLRYRVGANATAPLALVNGFEALSYELSNNAALSLTAAQPVTTTIGLTGNGSVTLAGSISSTDRTLVDASVLTTDQITGTGTGPTRALAITNGGTLTLTTTQAASFSQLYAVNGGGNQVVNNGTIAVVNPAGSYYPAIGIANASQATNAGTINLRGGTGISATTILNSGIITDTAGTGGFGVTSVTNLTNSGTIRVDRDAVQTSFQSATVTNSGTIESRQGTAVILSGYGSTLVNQAGGTLRGATTAVSLTSGSLTNRGTIVGNVAAAFSGGSNTYVADGGTVTGDVLFGSFNDTFVQFGTSGTGVSGRVDGGGGIDTFGYVLQASGTVRLGGDPKVVNFENALVQAAGADTVVTVTAASPFAGDLFAAGNGSVTNEATLGGSVRASPTFTAALLPGGSVNLASFTNNGSIAGAIVLTGSRLTNNGQIGNAALATTAVALNGDSLSFTNAGKIAAAPTLNAVSLAGTSTVSLTNSGSISGGLVTSATAADGAIAITNARGGVIATPASQTIAVQARGATLALDNAGTINGAVVAVGVGATTLRNSGTIAGTVSLGAGVDRVENNGTMTAGVNLGAGDDIFVQRAGATLGGIVDGSTGTDLLIVDSTGGGTIDAARFRNFERLQQTGTDAVSYAGTFGVGTIELFGGTIAVAAGQRLATAGATTVTGGADGVVVVNAGTIAGAVALGGGDDTYVEQPGSTVSGIVDGGAGTDTYRVILAGDRNGIGARTGFEQLALDGNGTLTLALDQNFDAIALNGPSLALALNGFSVGRINGSQTAAQLSLGGDATTVALGSGSDALSISGTIAAGRYSGGAGSDTLRFINPAGVTLTGSATDFEMVALAGNALTVAGTLGSAGAPLAFDDGNQSLTVAAGGRLAGTIDLGGGDDSFRLAAGSTLAGSVSGGRGNDIFIIEVPVNRSVTGSLTAFEQLRLEGAGTLTLAGTALSVDRVDAAGPLTIAADASLTTGPLTFGAGDDRLTIAGTFRGSVDGGAGTNGIDVSGGSADAPVAFGTVTNVAALRQSGGFATIAATAKFADVALTGGRLVGLAGSTITAPTIAVGQGATFGSAGVVNGNITVAGILSPGGSPGTMTVNGNVTIAAGSTSLFEITPTVSDKLVVNGKVSIAANTTLQLVPTGSITPGTSLDLIVASGGITGSYTSVVKPSTLFGFIVQQADRIQLLGQFLNDPSYAPQVQRSIAYLNALLTSGRASATLLAAVPRLATTSGASQVAAFNRLTPEPYAAARQMPVENGLALAEAGRSAGFAAPGSEGRLFSFGSALANWRALGADGNRGTSRAQLNGYGFLGGLGWGSTAFSLGAFVGYLHNEQRIASLGARTLAQGVVVGLHARLASGGFSLKATVAYDDGRARTRRALPDGAADGRYYLHGWTGDLSAGYLAALGGGWAVRPSLGITAIRTMSASVAETGGSAFALRMARRHDTTTFLDAGLTFSGAFGSGDRIRPFVSLGARYQASGRSPISIGRLDGADIGLAGEGAARAPIVAITTVGAEATVSTRLTLFGTATAETGDADRRGNIRIGARLAF